MGKNYCENRKLKKKGEVYFIKCGNLYKIGATTTLYTRLHSLQVANPGKCKLIHSIKTNDMYLTERLFKDMFTRVNTRGEWFDLSPKDIDYIKSGTYTDAIMRSIGVVESWTRVPDVLDCVAG
jgi:hypothetical protein